MKLSVNSLNQHPAELRSEKAERSNVTKFFQYMLTFTAAIELHGDPLVHVLCQVQDILLLWSLLLLRVVSAATSASTSAATTSSVLRVTPAASTASSTPAVAVSLLFRHLYSCVGVSLS